MKFIYVIFIFVSLHGLAQDEIWNKLMFNETSIEYYSIAEMNIDNYNNKYLISIEENSVGPKRQFIFLSKYNEFDEFLWKKDIISADKNDNIRLSLILVSDKNKNLSIAINFKDTISVEEQIYVSNGKFDGIYASYDLEGNLKYVEQFGGPCNDSIGDLAYNDDKSLIIAFNYGSNSFDKDEDCSFEFKDILIPKNKNNNSNYLICKIDEDRKVVWHQLGTIQYESVIRKIGMHKDKFYTFGSVEAWMDVNFHGLEVNFPNSLSKPNYIAQFDTSGSIKWLKYLGLSGVLTTLQISGLNAYDKSVTLTLNGITNDNGVFNNLVIQDELTLNGTTFSNVDCFIIKYNNEGKVNWATSSKSYGWVYATDVKPYKNNSTLVSGYFEYDLQFANDTLLTQGSNDIFIACYNYKGEEKWIKTAGGSGNDTANSLALDRRGRIYVCGGTASHPTTFGDITIEPPHPNNLYLARLSNDTIVGINPTEISTTQTTIYPNPAIDRISLKQSDSQQAVKNIVIYNIEGKPVLQNLVMDKQGIDVQYLPSGVYLLNILYTNGKHQMLKWCKQ